MELLFYRAAKGNWQDKLIALWTRGIYSHVEIRFSDGMCFSSSNRDGGTRFKKIYIREDVWDIIDIGPEKEKEIREWCEERVGLPYDWWGILGFVLPWIKNDESKWFCSEILSTALTRNGIFDLPSQISPIKFYRLVTAYI